MQGYFEFLLQHRKWVVLGGGLVFLLAAAFLPRLALDTNPDAFIPPGHPALTSKRRVEARFGLEDPMLVALVCRGPDGATVAGGIYAPDPLRLLQTLTREIQTLVASYPDVPAHAVYSLATEQDVEFERDTLVEMPFLEPFPTTPADFARLRERVHRLELYNGVLVSTGGEAAAIVVLPPPGAADGLYLALRDLARARSTKTLQILVAGEAAVRSAMGTAVTWDAIRLNPLCVAVIAFFLHLAFRSATGVLLPLLVVGWSCTVMLGLMSALGSPIYIITTSILVTVVSLGVADSIHVQGEYVRELGQTTSANAKSVIASVAARLWRPLFYVSITDLAGFLSLAVTGIMPPLEAFGIFTAVGCGATLLASMTILPCLLTWWRPRPAARGAWALTGTVSRWLGQLGDEIRRRPLPWIAAGGVFLVAASVASFGLRVDQSLLSAFDQGHEVVESDRVVNELFDGTHFLDVVIEASTTGGIADPKVLNSIHELETWARNLPRVKGSLSVAGFARKLNQIFNGWDAAALKIPSDRDTVREHFLLLEASPSKQADFLRTVDSTLTLANVRLRLSTGLYSEERPVVEAVAAEVARRFPSTGEARGELSGRVNLDYHWMQLILQSQIASVSCSMVLVFLLVFPLFRSLTAALFTILPILATVPVTYGVMAILDIPLSIGTSMFAALAMGVGVNFPIHVLERFRQALRASGGDEALAFRDVYSLTARALLFNGASVCFGFLILVVSSLPILRHFGLLLACSIGSSCLVSLTVVPALVAWRKPRFLYGADQVPH